MAGFCILDFFLLNSRLQSTRIQIGIGSDPHYLSESGRPGSVRDHGYQFKASEKMYKDAHEDRHCFDANLDPDLYRYQHGNSDPDSD